MKIKLSALLNFPYDSVLSIFVPVLRSRVKVVLKDISDTIQANPDLEITISSNDGAYHVD